MRMFGKNIPSSSPPISVAIIEDDHTIREGYTYLINNEGHYYVTGAYANAEAALAEMSQRPPQVILLDIELPGMSGLEVLPELRRLMPRTHILLLTVYDDEEHVFEALTLGAAGYLTKSTPAHKVIAAIDEVLSGGAPMSMGVARLVIKSFHRNTATSPLTRRETEILELVAAGKSRSKIATELFVDVETVKSHIKNIYAKLDVHSREDAIRLAKDQRLI